MSNSSKRKLKRARQQLHENGNLIKLYKERLADPNALVDYVQGLAAFGQYALEVIALIAAPLSHARHVERISEVMEKVAMRYSDAMVVYRKEDTRETELRRTAAAKAERQRIRKLPRQGT